MTKKFKKKYDFGGVVDPAHKPEGIKNISYLNPPRTDVVNTTNYLRTVAQGNIHKFEKEQARKWKNPFATIENTDVETGLQATLYGADAVLSYHDEQLNRQNYAQRVRNTFIQKPLYDYNNLWGPDSNGGAEYQPLIMAKDGAEIRQGAHPMTTNVEVEGGEFLQLPDLSTEHVRGASHNQGGVHTNLPPQARVFSDTLKPKGEKRTYAQLAKKHDTEKYKKILDNPYSTDIDENTAKLMFSRNQGALDVLFQDQQSQNGNSDGTKFKAGGEYLKFGDVVGVGTLPYEEWKKTKSPVIKDNILKKMYHDYLHEPTYTKPYQPTNPTTQLKPTTYVDENGEQVPIATANVKTPLDQTPIGKFVEQVNPILSNSGKSMKSKDENGYVPYHSLGPKDRTPKRGFDNSSKLTKEQIDELAFGLGYTGPRNNKALQKWLLSQPEYRDKILAMHEQYGDPLNPGQTPEKYIDGFLGVRWDATLQELSRSKHPDAAQLPTNPPIKTDTAKPYQTPPGAQFNAVSPQNQTASKMGKFPLYQTAPEALGYLSAINPYSYFTPDFDHNEVTPATLNIQPQINSINNSFQSGIRQNIGNASINNSRNTAMFNQSLEAKQQAFGNKQNYDANMRYQADVYNANARTEENHKDLEAAALVHNGYRAAALDNASTERLNAAFSLTDKVGKYYQDEYKKMMYFDTLVPDFYYDGNDRGQPIKKDSNVNTNFFSNTPKYNS